MPNLTQYVTPHLFLAVCLCRYLYAPAWVSLGAVLVAVGWLGFGAYLARARTEQTAALEIALASNSQLTARVGAYEKELAGLADSHAKMKEQLSVVLNRGGR